MPAYSTSTAIIAARRRPSYRRLALIAAPIILAFFILSLRKLYREFKYFRRRLARHGREFLRQRYQLARAALAHRVERQVELALNSCAAHARETFKDPSMPLAFQRAIDHIMDVYILPDVKQESFRVLDENFLPAPRLSLASPYPPSRTALSPLSPRHSRRAPPTPPQSPRVLAGLPRSTPSSPSMVAAAPAPPPVLQMVSDDDPHLHFLPPWVLLQLRRGRAAVLHTLWPHDRSLWSCLRSPRWWCLQLLGVLPLIGPWWWLLLAFAVDKQDEYQLCNFIVALRCTHFVTLGVGAALHSCIHSYRCAAFAHGPDDCAARMPKLTLLRGIFWAVQLLITSRAFLLLPHSKKKGQRVPVERRGRLSLEHRRALITGRPLPPDGLSAYQYEEPGVLPGVAERGGILPKLGQLDLALAALAACCTIIAVCLFHADPTLLGITLYHIRSAHGLLSCPYVLLRLPGASVLLTHARRTGYDHLGYCVPWNNSEKAAAHAAAAQAAAMTPRALPRSGGSAINAVRSLNAAAPAAAADGAVPRRLSFDETGETETSPQNGQAEEVQQGWLRKAIRRRWRTHEHCD